MPRNNKTDADETPELLADDTLDDVSAGTSGRRTELDHMGAYNFTIEIEGINSGSFKDIDGLSAETESTDSEIRR